MIKKISFITQDGVEIFGDYYSVSKSLLKHSKAVLILHMMPSNRKSFSSFARKLQSAGIPSLSIDLRGHGESIKKLKIPEGEQVPYGASKNQKLKIKEEDDSFEILDYKKFTDEEHQKSILDVESAVNFLNKKGSKNLILCGASIGANLSLKFIAENPDKAIAAILLSPGINYKGIEAILLAEKIKENKFVFIAAAKDDVRIVCTPPECTPADEMANIIFDHTKTKQKKRKIFETGGHGTNLFINHPEFEDELIEWILNIKK